jgi:hypothetical protein
VSGARTRYLLTMSHRATLAAAIVVLSSVTAIAATKSARPAKTPKPDVMKTDRGAPKDVTGTYRATGMGTDEFIVDVAQGDADLAIQYTATFGISTPPQICDCALDGKSSGDGKWTLSGGAKGTFAVMGDKLIIELETPADCCGKGYAGSPDFKLGAGEKPLACTVKSKSSLKDAQGAETKKLVAKGDKVEAFEFGSEEADDLILTRALGKKRTTGFLEASQIDCPVSNRRPKPGSAATPAPEPATP